MKSKNVAPKSHGLAKDNNKRLKKEQGKISSFIICDGKAGCKLNTQMPAQISMFQPHVAIAQTSKHILSGSGV